eukprot:262621-Chlamydomonas_euryale.AAC.4
MGRRMRNQPCVNQSSERRQAHIHVENVACTRAGIAAMNARYVFTNQRHLKPSNSLPPQN